MNRMVKTIAFDGIVPTKNEKISTNFQPKMPHNFFPSVVCNELISKQYNQELFVR